jgi:hypothetical protein
MMFFIIIMTPNTAFSYNIEYLVSADALGHNSVVTPHSAFIYNIEYLVSADALGHNFVVTSNTAFSYNIEYLVSAGALVTTPLLLPTVHLVTT